MHSKIFQSRVSALPFFVLFLGLTAGLVACEAETREDSQKESSWGFELSRELMSPYCPGRTLADCPSSQADDLKSWIYEEEEKGRTRAEVEQELLKRFGETMLGAPRAQGVGLAAYWIPALLFLLGGWIAWRFLRRQKLKQAQAAAAAPTPAATLTPEISQILEEEMRE